MELARPLAMNGDPDAIFLMGFALESSPQPARRSKAQALAHYYRKASEAGHPEGEMRLKLVYLASGTQEEIAATRHELEASAARGDGAARRFLGEACLRGLTGKVDVGAALEHWTKAAEAGDASASMLLARFHEGHFGFPEKRSVREAIRWYRRAAANEIAEASVPLGRLLMEQASAEGVSLLESAGRGGHVNAWLALGDHALAAGNRTDLARQYFLKGAEMGEANCMRKLAGLYPGGEAANAADDWRQTWLMRAVKIGDPHAAEELAIFLMKKDRNQDAQVRRLLLSASSEGRRTAQYHLGCFYLEGRGGDTDPVAAVAWLTEAMKGGDPETQFLLAKLHEQGIGTPINFADAGVLYTLASNKGHAAAAARIAWMASEGLGTKANPVHAWAYASLAIERGERSADELLRKLDMSLDTVGKAKALRVLDELKVPAAPAPPHPTEAGGRQ